MPASEHTRGRPTSRRFLAKHAVSLMSLVLLAGCATLSREQCRSGDWYGIGTADGQAGEPLGRLDRHVRACAEYGIPVDEQRYRAGYDQGLRAYCHIHNACAAGLRGHRYQRVCPPEIDGAFERCNRAALAVYRLRRELDEVSAQRHRYVFWLWNNPLSEHDAYLLRHELRALDRRYDQLRIDLYLSERFLDDLMDEVGARPSP